MKRLEKSGFVPVVPGEGGVQSLPPPLPPLGAPPTPAAPPLSLGAPPLLATPPEEDAPPEEGLPPLVPLVAPPLALPPDDAFAAPPLAVCPPEPPLAAAPPPAGAPSPGAGVPEHPRASGGRTRSAVHDFRAGRALIEFCPGESSQRPGSVQNSAEEDGGSGAADLVPNFRFILDDLSQKSGRRTQSALSSGGRDALR